MPGAQRRSMRSTAITAFGLLVRHQLDVAIARVAHNASPRASALVRPVNGYRASRVVLTQPCGPGAMYRRGSMNRRPNPPRAAIVLLETPVPRPTGALTRPPAAVKHILERHA